MELSPGAKVGPYEVLAPLGAGGMGQVWRARDPRLGREVAIKVINQALAGDATLEARFEREARALSALNHPNIVTVYDVGEQEGARYIVSELIHGESLRQAMQRGPLPVEQAIALTSQIASALAAAHAAGIVHRDLKPENIMITAEGNVKILDFGLARHVKQQPQTGDSDTTLTQSTMTQPGVVMGTAGYMSPEQICGDDVDLRSDIFSTGVVLYEMASGRRAFKGRTSMETMSSVLKDEAPHLDGPPSGLLDRIVQRCLEKNPANRYQSATELRSALTALPGAARPKRPGWIVAAASAAVVVLAVAWWMTGRNNTPPRAPAPVAPSTPAAPAPAATPEKAPEAKSTPARPAAAVKPAVANAHQADVQRALEEGMFLLGQRRWNKAAERFGDAIGLDPRSGMGYLGRCRAESGQQDFEKAIADCSGAIRLMPNSADAYHERGNAYLMTQAFDRAVEDLNAAIKLGDTEMAAAHNLRGRAHSGLKEWGDALADFDEAIRLNPNQAHFYVFRSIAYNARSQFKKAIDDCNQALKLQPNLPMAYTQRAIARQRTGDAAGAAGDRNQAKTLRK